MSTKKKTTKKTTKPLELYPISEVTYQLGPVEEPTTIALGRTTLITGPVAVGKSTILRAVRLAIYGEGEIDGRYNDHAPGHGECGSILARIRVTSPDGQATIGFEAKRRTRTQWDKDEECALPGLVPKLSDAISGAAALRLGPQLLEKAIVERWARFPDGNPIDLIRGVLRRDEERAVLVGAVEEVNKTHREATHGGRLVQLLGVLESRQRDQSALVGRLERQAEEARGEASEAATERPSADDLDPLAVRLLVKARSVDDHPDDCPVCSTRVKGLGKRLQGLAKAADAPVARGAYRDREALLRDAHEAKKARADIESVKTLVRDRVREATIDAMRRAIAAIEAQLPDGQSVELAPGDRGGVVWRGGAKGATALGAMSGYERAALTIAVARAWTPAGLAPIVLLDDDDLSGFSIATIRSYARALIEAVRKGKIAQVIMTRHADRAKTEGLLELDWETFVKLGDEDDES